VNTPASPNDNAALPAPWEALIPSISGTLPEGAPLYRTDPSGSLTASVVILGVYPALTEKKQLTIAGTRMWLPTQVERHSFAQGSASGAEIDTHYLDPLGLSRASVRLLDLLPYYFANTTKSTSGRSMADNVAAYERATGQRTGIQARPNETTLVRLATEMPGNLDRLRHTLAQGAPRLLPTLGLESAAFIRGYDFARANREVEQLLYGSAESLQVLGITLQVVHLAHPHLFIKKNEKWTTRHHAWCESTGRALVSAVTQ